MELVVHRPTPSKRHPNTEKARQLAGFRGFPGFSCSGSYRDRTDDIHGVNVEYFRASMRELGNP